MTRYRTVGLVFSLACLLGTPFAFADKNKGSGGDSAKSSPPPQHSAPQHSSSSHDSGTGQHGSNHGSAGSGSSTQSSPSSAHSSSSSGSGYRSNDHSGDHHAKTSQSSTSSESHVNSRSGHGNNSGDVLHRGSSPSERTTHGQSSRSASSYHGTRDWHGHVTVDHARLNERLHAQSSTVERQHAFEHSRVERARFTRYVAPIHFVPAHRAVLMNLTIVPTTYHYRRTAFYDTYDWQPPAYVFGLYPRYGLWDATFLAFALDHVSEEQYALMFYNHQNDGDMQQWMEDTSRLAADNDDLRAKLDTMKTQMASLDQSGRKTDPSYVPPDAQDVALSPEVITQLTATK